MKNAEFKIGRMLWVIGLAGGQEKILVDYFGGSDNFNGQQHYLSLAITIDAELRTISVGDGSNRAIKVVKLRNDQDLDEIDLRVVFGSPGFDVYMAYEKVATLPHRDAWTTVSSPEQNIAKVTGPIQLTRLELISVDGPLPAPHGSYSNNFNGEGLKIGQMLHIFGRFNAPPWVLQFYSMDGHVIFTVRVEPQTEKTMFLLTAKSEGMKQPGVIGSGVIEKGNRFSFDIRMKFEAETFEVYYHADLI